MNKRIEKKRMINRFKSLGVTFTYIKGFNEKVLYNSPKWEEDIAICGIYKNHRFVIVDFNGHPCAYTEHFADHDYVFDSNLCRDDEDDRNDDEYIFIMCHGGVSFVAKRNFLSYKKEKIIIPTIGWDYGHWTDYQRYNGHGKTRYTLTEIILECMYVIEQLIIHGF